MPNTLPNFPVFWSIETVDYNHLYGLDLNFESSGSLLVQNTANLGEQWNFSFSHFRPSSSARGVEPPIIENYENIFKTTPPSSLTFWQIQTPPRSSNPDVAPAGFTGNNGTFYYLAIDTQGNNHIFQQNLITFVFSQNPTQDDSIFEQLLSPGYQISQINPSPVPASSVPEPSFELGLVIVGLVGVAMLCKRKLSQLLQNSREQNGSLPV